MGKISNMLLLVISFLVVLFAPIPRAYAHSLEDAVTVHIDEKGFTPKAVTIQTGQTVIFENAGRLPHWPASNIHPTHQIYPEFDPKRELAPGETWQFTFNKVGTWRMHDHIFSQLTGEISVKGEAERLTLWQRILAFLGFKRKPIDAKPKVYASQYTYNSTIQKNDTSIAKDKAALYSYVKKFGPKEATLHLASLESTVGDCHQMAHSLGNFSYEIYGEKTFGMCSSECHSGCYHGATEAYFKEHGTENLDKNLQTICASDANAFQSHNCHHGIGHGLMAWSDYDLPKALESCNLLPSGRDSCYSGVFMENVVGGLSATERTTALGDTEKHYTKYLNNDPQYPCNAVDPQYKSACYFFQTSRMVQLMNWDFKKVSEECQNVPQAYQDLCFESLGRDIAGNTLNNPEKSLALCAYAPPGSPHEGCLRGAVNNTFWDPSGQDTALAFCELVVDAEEKQTCYQTIFAIGEQILSTRVQKEQFCQKAEQAFVASCREYFGYQ